jgi:nucleolar protein 56
MSRYFHSDPVQFFFTMFLLLEHATGFALFKVNECDEIMLENLDIQQLHKIVNLHSFMPFKSAVNALENTLDVTQGICSSDLLNILQMLPKKSTLLVSEPTLGGDIKQKLGLDCQHNNLARELLRSVRVNLSSFVKVPLTDLDKAQLGLGHAYSRSKVKFNVNRVDNMITQSISLLDQIDKDVNTFAMRVREWYGWHFPELIKIVSDTYMYAKLVKVIQNKNSVSLEKIDAVIEDPVISQQIVNASNSSIGTDISEVDLANIMSFADKVISLVDYRKSLHKYLCNKMQAVCPNVTAVIGEMVGARLISHAGSLTNLAKYPASTLQILGAEKALFRALKTKGNTPKYGLIYHSTFISRAGQKNKGRISRVLANKVSIASRIDCFTDSPSSTIGEFLREQVEERLRFYETGVAPRKNEDVMAEALAKAGIDIDIDVEEDEDIEKGKVV